GCYGPAVLGGGGGGPSRSSVRVKTRAIPPSKRLYAMVTPVAVVTSDTSEATALVATANGAASISRSSASRRMMRTTLPSRQATTYSAPFHAISGFAALSWGARTTMMRGARTTEPSNAICPTARFFFGSVQAYVTRLPAMVAPTLDEVTAVSGSKVVSAGWLRMMFAKSIRARATKRCAASVKGIVENV